MSARAALDAARAVFAPSMGRAPAQATTAPEWVELPGGASSPRARSVAMWGAAEQVLQAIVGRVDLSGQMLVGEARRLQRLSLGEAHALIALHGWLDRQRDPANTEAEREALPRDDEQRVAHDAWQALERAVSAPTAPIVTQPVAQVMTHGATPPASQATFTRPIPNALPYGAPLGAQPATASRADVSPPPPWTAPSVATGAAPSAADVSDEDAPSVRRRWYRSRTALFGAVALLLILAGGGAWYVVAGRRGHDYRDGVEAYQRGSREVARMAFARAAQADGNDVRPLVFLGRMAREENDLPRSRRFLEAAVRIDPANATALRELASALLADGQPEIARRFYVRSLELAPTDKLAQGFLGCALFRLGRIDEARRWVDRAGPGEWTPCVSGPPPLMPPVPAPIPPP